MHRITKADDEMLFVSNLEDSFFTAFKDEQFCDIVINASDDKKIVSHRVILFSKCPDLEKIVQRDNEKNIYFIDLLDFNEISVISLIE